MVAIVHGSSHFKPIGTTAITGGSGDTGGIGPTGSKGFGRTGHFGHTGGRISNMYLVDDDKLYTEFTLGYAGITGAYTTTTKIKGPTGDTYNLIDVGNTYSPGDHLYMGGATFGKGRNANFDLNTIVIKSIEVTGDKGDSVISLVQDESIDTINIHYDRGNFGFFDVEDGSALNLVQGSAAAGGLITAIGGTTYDVSSSLEIEGLGKNYNALDVKITNYKERTKYLIVGAGGDVLQLGDPVEGEPIYTTPPDTPIDPNRAKTFLLDMRQLDGVDADGFTGGVQLRFRDAHFGYTGNKLESDEQVRNLSKAFTLVVHGATCGYEQVRFDGNNIIWPLDLEPCWSGKTDIFNFFWLPCEPRDLDEDGIIDKCPKGAAWHGNVIQWDHMGCNILQGTTADPFWCHLEEEEVPYRGNSRNYPFIGGLTGTTGACCVGDGRCVYTTEDLCGGYYFGTGTTCGAGGTGSVCYEDGACCVTNEQTKGVVCYDDMSSNECIDIGNLLNNISAFGGTGSDCTDMHCGGVLNKKGACCDGMGSCKQLTRTECLKRNGYFLGVGMSCTSGTHGFSVCIGGTGACCNTDGTCSDGMSGPGCLRGGNIYAGHSTLCADIECGNNTLNSTVPEIAGLNLQPGDIYAGGMVVGIYRPFGSELFGKGEFGGGQSTPWQKLMEGGTGATSDARGFDCERYRSKFDYHGYGFDSEGCPSYNTMLSYSDESRPDAYYIITSMHPLGITGDRDIINPSQNPGATSEFYWGNHGSSWGPLYNQMNGQEDDITKDYRENFVYSEGYWYDVHAGKISLDTLPTDTFTSCRRARRLGHKAIQKLRTKPLHTAHGRWHRNWGMYNTIRIISADNALSQNYDDPYGNYDSDDFGPGLTAGYVSAFRAARLYDDNFITTDGATGSNENNVSSWYLPSHDEMSFIARNCLPDGNDGFNLNVKLFEEGGTPFRGWYWTSTGAFNETKGRTAGIGEGLLKGSISNGDGPVPPIYKSLVSIDPGTVAWAMKFDVNGNSNNFKVGKKDRTHNTYQVRPIRIVRCDGRFLSTNDINYKLWKLPNVLRDIDKGINQGY